MCSAAQALRRLLSAGIATGLVVTACSERPPSALAQVERIGSPSTASRLPVRALATAIEAGLATGRDPAGSAITSNARQELSTLYSGARAYAPLWVDAAGRPTRSAREALALVSSSEADGLDPADYHASDLHRLAAVLAVDPHPSAGDAARFELGLSVGMLRYFRDLHMGRVDPRHIGFQMTAPSDEHNFAARLLSAVADRRIAETALELQPQFAQYRALRAQLTRYRALAADATLASPSPLEDTVRPGEPYPKARALFRRLVAFGDLPKTTPPPSDPSVYTGPLVDGVKRFQARHGLETDGILGKATLAALQVPLRWRVRQIAMSLERLRWLPHLADRRFVIINIPTFHLWAWNGDPWNGQPSLSMGVIVGRALRTQTPVFVGDIRYVVFRPYWNVPPGILRNEVLPAIEKDPEYLARENMEIVSALGDTTKSFPATPEHLAMIREGGLRVRQRPGPGNALGLIKFVFPNEANVYMHGTPARELFRRPRRDFSHGCIRLEDPAGLAEWILVDQPEWTRERILAAMGGTRSQRVNLTEPVPVVLYYLTAVVMPGEETIRFAEDIYGYDERLAKALTSQPRA